jgi:2-keto-4-pentenoate hydratase/2-oxohepta-3-ene-1,7-dioic acid hydratase in catechol pathway
VKLANLHGRATLVVDQGTIDVEKASEGRFSADTGVLVGQLEQVRSWFDEQHPDVTESTTLERVMRDPGLGPVIAQPGQVFAIGLNYRTHAKEMALTLPTKPMVFTKFPSSVAGANASFSIVSAKTDWESELVVVFAKRGRHLALDESLTYVAGYCVGQDLSDRELQLLGSPAQFSLGKSYENFAPFGPWLTTIDEIPDPNKLAISCEVNGVRYQDSNTSDMVFSVAQLVSYLSSVVEIRPGDIMYTGSPHGVGQGQKPPRFLQAGDVLETTIEGLGSLRNVGVARDVLP